MKLPAREKAYIPPAKIFDYLLSHVHSVGKAKANFFREFDFDEANAGSLETGLLRIAQQEDVASATTTRYGVKYVVDGSLATPTGITVNVRTVWVIESGEEAPRFVTAHPLPK